MNKKRGQSAIEFVVIFAFVLFFFIGFFAVIQGNIGQKNLEKQRILAQNIALGVQSEINLAAESSNGYYREFDIPSNLLGKEYEINITGNRVYVSGDKIGVSYRIQEINGTIKKGTNIIKKENTTVKLNEE